MLLSGMGTGGGQMVKNISPAIRATDYKCPKYAWISYESE